VTPPARGSTGRPAVRPTAYLRSGQVDALLHVDPKTVSRWARAGKLPYVRTVGGQRRYPEAEIRKLGAALVQSAGPPLVEHPGVHEDGEPR